MMESATLLLVLLVGTPQGPDQLLNRVQKTYRGAKGFTASFTQTYVAKLRPKPRQERGKMWAARDGRVRWTYEKPQKDFIYDGQQAYFYEPENQQVTIFEKFKDSQLARATQFLWGQGDLREAFDVVPCGKDCAAPESGQKTLKLKLKQPVSSVKDVLLVIDTKRYLVKRSLVRDSLGNETTYAFADVQFGAKFKPGFFKFEPPPEAHILKADAGPEAKN